MIDNVSSMCFPIGYDLFFSTGGEIFKTGFCGIIYHTVGRLTRGRGGGDGCYHEAEVGSGQVPVR